MKFSIVSLNVGKISRLKAGKREVESGYSKSSVESAILTRTGFKNDEQADLKHHGGLDKAVCVYSTHNFLEFEKLLQHEMPVPAFGENFSVDKADENELFIGDVFQSGDVKVEISQPRQPCFKTGAFHGNNAVIKLMSDTGKTGFYFRVISEGVVKEGDSFERIESDSVYSLKYANDIMYRRNRSLEDLRKFINHPKLSDAWKNELSARLDK